VKAANAAHTLRGETAGALDRLAASPEIVEAISRHFKSDGMPSPAATHLAAEVASHPDAIDTNVARFQDFLANYRSKGFSDEAAQHLAVEALESGDEPSRSRRFQLLHDDEPLEGLG
jgi:hypothetical protein